MILQKNNTQNDLKLNHFFMYKKSSMQNSKKVDFIYFINIYDLADKIKEKLEKDIEDLYQDERLNQYNSNDFSKIFQLIKNNQLFFKTYFKLGFDSSSIYKYDTNQSKLFYNDEYIDYHIEFFKSGFTAIIKKWLNNGCKESIEDMCKILSSEYSNKI